MLKLEEHQSTLDDEKTHKSYANRQKEVFRFIAEYISSLDGLHDFLYKFLPFLRRFNQPSDAWKSSWPNTLNRQRPFSGLDFRQVRCYGFFFIKTNKKQLCPTCQNYFLSHSFCFLLKEIYKKEVSSVFKYFSFMRK